nr:hypothetical protein [Tanacetum cinerariifolium]
MFVIDFGDIQWPWFVLLVLVVCAFGFGGHLCSSLICFGMVVFSVVGVWAVVWAACSFVSVLLWFISFRTVLVYLLLVISGFFFTLRVLLSLSDNFSCYGSYPHLLLGAFNLVMSYTAASFIPYLGFSTCFGCRAELTLKRMGIWLCGACFKTHTPRSKCRHGTGFVPPPDNGDGIVRFVLYDLTRPPAPSCSQLDQVDDLFPIQHDGFTLSLLDSLYSNGKSIPSKCRLCFSRVLKGALDKVVCKSDDISYWVSLLVLPLCLLKTFCPRSNLECKSANKQQRQKKSITNDIRSWGVHGGSLQLVREILVESAYPILDLDEEDLDLNEQNPKQCKRKIYDGHYTVAVRVLSSSGVAPYNDATHQDLKAKHPFKSAPSLPDIPIDHHHLIASQDVVLDKIKSFHQGTSCGHDGLRAQHLMDCLGRVVVAISDELFFSITQAVNLFLKGKCPMMLGEYIASAPLTPPVKPGGGIRPIAIGIVWRRLVSKVSATMIVYSLDGYLDDRTVMLEEVRIRCPAIYRWVEFCYSSPTRLYYGEHSLWSCQGVQQGDPLGPLMFSLVLHPLICKIKDSYNLCLHAWYLDDGTIVGDTLVVCKVLDLITGDGSRCGLHLNVDKTEFCWPKEDPRSRLVGVFPPNMLEIRK